MAALRNAAQADDLVQEAFLVAWSNLDRYDRSLPFGPWVRGIAARLIWNHRRKLGRAKVQYCEEEDLQALEHKFDQAGRLPGDVLVDKVDALRVGLERLSSLQRRALQLHYEDGLQCREIAVRLGVGEEAVKKHLQRGRAALMREIGQRLESPGGQPIYEEA